MLVLLCVCLFVCLRRFKRSCFYDVLCCACSCGTWLMKGDCDGMEIVMIIIRLMLILVIMVMKLTITVIRIKVIVVKATAIITVKNIDEAVLECADK